MFCLRSTNFVFCILFFQLNITYVKSSIVLKPRQRARSEPNATKQCPNRAHRLLGWLFSSNQTNRTFPPYKHKTHTHTHRKPPYCFPCSHSIAIVIFQIIQPRSGEDPLGFFIHPTSQKATSGWRAGRTNAHGLQIFKHSRHEPIPIVIETIESNPIQGYALRPPPSVSMGLKSWTAQGWKNEMQTTNRQILPTATNLLPIVCVCVWNKPQIQKLPASQPASRGVGCVLYQSFCGRFCIFQWTIAKLESIELTPGPGLTSALHQKRSTKKEGKRK